LFPLAALFLCALSGIVPLSAAPAARPIQDLLRKVYGTDEVLPQSTVRSLTHTADGYLWAATQAGITRFDGFRFRTFDVRNSPGLPHNNIHVVEAGRDGTLLAETYTQGAVRGRNGVFTRIPGVSNQSVNALLEDREGTVWVGTSSGLITAKDGKVSSFTAAEGLAGRAVMAIAQDRQGRVWVGTDRGLNLFDHGSLRRFHAKEAMDGLPICCFSVEQDSLWVAAGRMLLRLEDARSELRRGFPMRMRTQSWRPAMARCGSPREGRGLNHYVNGKIRTYTTRDGLTSNVILSIGESKRTGTIWAGTLEGGLHWLENGRFRHMSLGASVQVTHILEARDGSLWVATSAGLHRIENGAIAKTYTTAEGLPNNRVAAVLEARDGSLWVSTSMGFSHLQQGVFTNFWGRETGPSLNPCAVFPRGQRRCPVDGQPGQRCRPFPEWATLVVRPRAGVE
jgi:ligand-binding sensor domain-containing protein